MGSARKPEAKIGWRHISRGFLRPFDQTDCIAMKVLSKTGIHKLLRRLKAIKIKVITV